MRRNAASLVLHQTSSFNYSSPCRQQPFREIGTIGAAWKNVKKVVRVLRGKDDETSPRVQQERTELYMSLLAVTHRRLREERLSSLLSSTEIISSTSSRDINPLSPGGTSIDNTETREDMERLIEEATTILQEEMSMQNLSNVQLRYELQNLLAEDVMKMFKTFQTVDACLPPSASNMDIEEEDESEKDMWGTMLEGEYANVCRSLNLAIEEDQKDVLEKINRAEEGENNHAVDEDDEDENRPIPKRPSRVPFLSRKRGAIRTLLDFDPNAKEATLNDDASIAYSETTADDFGYIASQSDPDITRAIRRHQTINMVKSSLIKNNQSVSSNLDYSILALKSTIPHAGRGIFIDGTARAGSLLAFFPGQIWPKEFLLQSSASSKAFFKQDDTFHLSMRYDDILVDSRRAPYTVLNGKHTNPWALAHVANHPPPGERPNCRTVMIDFTEKMLKKGSAEDLWRYVPNTYARQPSLFGPKALDRDVILMHGFGLLAVRDVRDEELFYDYRLSPPSKDGESGMSAYPEWYHVIDQEEVDGRWYRDEN